MKKLSLAMIVKNEEDVIERCLNSCKDFVDEIVIVDTGSTDKTIEIAKKFDAKIFHYTWDNNFSNARNFSIENSTGDFNLFIDADEYITHFNKKSLDEYMNSNKTVGRIRSLHLFNGSDEVKETASLISRIAPKNTFFKGAIHEQLDANLIRKDVDIEIIHDGYLEDVLVSKNKFERNINLIIEQLKVNPDDNYMLYQASKTYFINKKYKEADEYFLKYFNLKNCSSDIFYPEAVVNSIYNAVEIKKFDFYLELIEKNKSKLSNRCDFWFALGIFYMELIKFDTKKYVHLFESIKDCYLKALEVGEPSNFSGVVGTGTFSAAHNLGVFYELLGDGVNAKKYYNMSNAFKSKVTKK